ncbi:MAG: lysophospholipid acyltransferase family protein [Flavobacteriales bacterium]|nr:lysophospholipid acyltransferase family protein [Bacteroidota bacterium]MCB9239516.1 lysophospholipid acyltransferase family protein [Flavobacteriales bacterium]
MLSKLGYYLFIKPISMLPMPVLYGISNLLYVVMYRLVGYRKKVVNGNLTHSFPNASSAWIKEQESRFYRHFCDLIVESIKLFSISNDEILKRFVFENPEVVNRFSQEGRSVIIVGGHFNNWEILASGIDQQCDHQAVGIYKKLSNAFYDQKVRDSRGRFGLKLLPTTDVARFFDTNDSANTMTLFGADQSPTHSKNVYWLHFLHQETAVALGTEHYARKYNLPVLYGFIQKTTRGHYTFRVEVIHDQPKESEPGDITVKHVRMLEEQINQQPEFWLWTHRRWKRKRKPDEELHG